MATGATFQDSQGTDFLGRQQNFMQRAQNMKIQREQQDMEKAKFAAFLPAIIAKREADVVSAQASIANTARMEKLRGQAAASSPGYNDRFLNIMMDPKSTPQTRSESLAILQGEVGWMEIIPEFKGFVDAVNNARAQQVTTAITNSKLDEALERAKSAAEGRLGVAQIQAGAKTANAETYSQSRERIAQINADTKLSVEEKRAQIATTRQGAQLADLQNRAAQADQAAADAAAAGDEQAAATHRAVAASYRDAVTKSTTFSGSTPSAPRDASQDPRPTPPQSNEPMASPITFSVPGQPSAAPAPSTAAQVVAPTRVDPKATKISIGGKDYPIFVDKNGNRAYKVDGHYVPIKAE
jgi:hypothetical protein